MPELGLDWHPERSLPQAADTLSLRHALCGRVWREGSADSHQPPVLGKPPDWKEGKGQQLVQLNEEGCPRQELNPSSATYFSHTTLPGSLSPWEPFLVPV